MPRREVRNDFTSSSESEDSGVDPFAEQPNKDFVIPDSVGLSDDEEPSPSLYRLQREREDADDPEDDEEEEEEAAINSDEEHLQETDPRSAKTGSSKVSSAEAVYTKFINMGRQFVADLEDQRKQDLMARKAARKSLDFDDVRPPRGQQLQFTPPRKTKDLIPESDEESSMRSGSSRSTRIRLQEKFKIVGCKKFCDMSRADIDTWIENVAHADMLRSGNYEDLKKKPRSIGGYVHAHVSHSIFHSQL